MDGFAGSVEGTELARRRKLLEVLGQQSAAAPIVGNTGMGQALAKMLTQVLLDKQDSKLSDEFRAGSDKYGLELGRESGNYIDTMQGKPAKPFEIPANEMDQESTTGMGGAVAPNPKAAIVAAMTSRMPEMQALGKAGMAGVQKQQLNPLDILKLDGFDPKSRVTAAMTGQIAGLTPKQSEHVINNKLIRSNGSDAPAEAGSYGPVYGEVGNVGTDPQTGKPIVGQKELETGKVAFAPTGTTVNVDTKGNNIALQELPAVLKDVTGRVTNAYSSLQAAERLFKLSQDPQILAGFGGGVAQGFAGIAARLNLTGPEAASKTQALVTDLASATLEKGEKMKGTFSDADLKFLREAAAGSVEMTPETIQHIAGLAFAANHNIINYGGKQYESAGSVTGGSDIKKLYPMPDIMYQAPHPTNFKADDHGNMRYDSPLFKPTSGNTRPTRGGGTGATTSNW